ncbi:MAG: nucleoside triphosphate pyrophosphohydrolase [Pseudobdellovibrio sp.]
MPQAPKTLNQFDSLVQVVRDLRGPEGCPWDREQTHKSLTPYAIEEVYELVEALETGDDPHACEELGDVLFQVVLHAQLAEERGAYRLTDVIESIVSKIVRRHPHVFSDTKVNSADEVIKNWDEIKMSEKKNKKAKSKTFDIPPGMPALQVSNKIGEKTEKYKFDWSEPQLVLAQLKSEITELEEAMKAAKKNPDHISHELGDVLFSAAQLARHLNVEPESSLREANMRFSARFEKMLSYSGGLENFISLSPEDKEQLWKKAKSET